MAKAKPLSHKQQGFVDEYIKDRNATQAAIRAGYAKGRSAGVQGTRLLADPRIAAAIRERLRAASEAAGATAAAVLGELRLVGMSDIRHYKVDGATGDWRLAEGAPPEAWRAVASARVRTTTRTTEAGTETVVDAELRLWSKPDALRMLGENLGLFPQKHRFLVGEDLGRLSDEELARRRKEVGLA